MTTLFEILEITSFLERCSAPELAPLSERSSAASHFAEADDDQSFLLELLQELVDAGNTV